MKIARGFFIGAAIMGFGLATTSAEALTVPKQHGASTSVQRSTWWVEQEKKPKIRHVHKAKKHATWHKHAKSHKLAKKD